MGKGYLLDSNTVIDYIACLHSEKSREWLNQIIDNEINVSLITKIEVPSFDPDKDDNYPILIDFFDSARIFELNTDIVNKTIQIRQKQKIKLPDAIIAATAIVNELALITRNISDFKGIEGFHIINPWDM